MDDSKFQSFPKQLKKIEIETNQLTFNMASDYRLGALLRTLASSKPGGRFLELGTGTGYGTSWIADGMDKKSTFITVDNDKDVLSVAKKYLDYDPRISIIEEDGGTFINHYSGEKFDLIFADAWPGKYEFLDLTLDLIKPGGFYVIDDLLPQQNWPEGHLSNVKKLITTLEKKEAFNLTKLNWSTGIVLATKLP